LSYLHLDVDGFTEKESRHSLGLDVEGRSVKSLQSAIGAQIAKAISTQSGVITPYAGIEWNHEFESNGSDIVAKYTHDPFNTFFTIPTADPDRDYFTLRAGITSIFPSGVAAFANIDTVLGLKDTTSTSLTIGMRVEF
jgi:outer membrane autotransporter protein